MRDFKAEIRKWWEDIGMNWWNSRVVLPASLGGTEVSMVTIMSEGRSSVLLVVINVEPDGRYTLTNGGLHYSNTTLRGAYDMFDIAAGRRWRFRNHERGLKQ